MIHIQDVTHTFSIGKKGKEKRVPVLKNVTMDINKGEIVTIVGKSGSGKSTLLHVLAGVMKPESITPHIQGT
jgi:acetoin utilization transport system ATP-binding protein